MSTEALSSQMEKKIVALEIYFPSCHQNYSIHRAIERAPQYTKNLARRAWQLQLKVCRLHLHVIPSSASRVTRSPGAKNVTSTQNGHSIYQHGIHLSDDQNKPKPSATTGAMVSVPRVPRCQGQQARHQTSPAPHCGDTITQDADLKALVSQGLQLSIMPTAKKPTSKYNSDSEGAKEAACFAGHPHIYQLFGDKTVSTSTSDAPPLEFRPPLKMPGMPPPRSQALHAQSAHPQRQHGLAPLHHTPRARSPDQEA